MKEFSVSLDKRAKMFTALGIVLFVVIFYPIFTDPKGNPETKTLSLILIFVLLLLTYLIPYLFHPVKYVIDDEKLIIKRPLKPYIIELKEIKKIEPLDDDALKGKIRVFGSGGAFGYFGKFRNKRFGTMIFFATRLSNYVHILTIDGKNIILTPDEREDFVNTITNKIG